MKTIDPFKKIPNRIGELIEESNKTNKPRNRNKL